MKKLISVFLASLFAVSGSFAQKAAVTGTVNMERLMNDYVAYQTAVTRVEGSEQTAKEEVEKLKDKLGLVELESRVQDLRQKASNPAIADEERKSAEVEVQQLLKDNQAKIQQLNAFGQQLQKKNQQARQTALAPFQLKAREAIVAVAKDKAIDLVVPIIPRELKLKDAAGVETEYNFFDGQIFYADDALEITDAVIAVLNAQ